MKDAPAEKDKEPGLLLNSHRKTVESTKGMSSAVLLGSSFAFAMGIFSWMGIRWDEKHDSEPWGVLVGVSLGLLYGVYEVWKVTRAAEPPSSKSPPETSEESRKSSR